MDLGIFWGAPSAAGAPRNVSVSAGGGDFWVLPGPPRNVSVSAGGARGELCVRWAPPPGPYLASSLVFELALSPPGGPPKTVGVPAGRREQRVGGLRAGTPYSVRARARPDGLSYGGFWSPWSRPGSASTAPGERTLRAKLWPPVPGPEREFEGLFSAYGGNFQLWLCQAPGSPRAPPAMEAEEAPDEVGEGPGLAPPAEPPPEGAEPRAPGPSPSPSFEYTLFEPGPALLRPAPRPAGHAPCPPGHAHCVTGHAPCSSDHAPCIKDHAHCSPAHTPCTPDHAPCPTGHAPCSSGHAHCPADHAHCPPGHAPCHTDHAPCSTGHAPCSTGHAPCSTGHAPCSTDHAPCSTDHAPCSTGHAPCLTDHVHCSPGHAPCPTDHAPCPTDHAPCPTDHAPYANLGHAHKGAEPKWGAGHAHHYVICS
uniref:erythropoietin receptor n=1 Tax=Lonchura striata TaxID=40157 RepID=UPI0012933B9B|nr:erythropoietin receptor [Lonchura striata domestica]